VTSRSIKSAAVSIHSVRLLSLAFYNSENEHVRTDFYHHVPL